MLNSRNLVEQFWFADLNIIWKLWFRAYNYSYESKEFDLSQLQPITPEEWKKQQINFSEALQAGLELRSNF